MTITLSTFCNVELDDEVSDSVDTSFLGFSMHRGHEMIVHMLL
jgi:hypothetical protein